MMVTAHYTVACQLLTCSIFRQGPALYAYNDALFTEQDWTGIRMLQDSIKEADSTKIGRFGLGFKSVFHLTGIRSAATLNIQTSSFS
jgi:hypothetical protein